MAVAPLTTSGGEVLVFFYAFHSSLCLYLTLMGLFWTTLLPASSKARMSKM